MPLATGITVQEQAAIKKLEMEAKEKDFSLLVAEPKYLIIASLDIKLTIAPASKKAGMRQVKTCKAIYSFKADNPATIKSITIMIFFLKLRLTVRFFSLLYYFINIFF